MLWQRVLTAVPLAVLVIWVLLSQPTELVNYLLFLVVFISALEWARLSGLQNILLSIVFATFIVVLCWYMLEYQAAVAHWYVLLAVIWWFLTAVYIVKVVPKPVQQKMSVLKLSSGVLVMPAAVIAMSLVHAGSDGPQWLLYGLMLVWLADIGAYFSGRRFGKTKLAPALSPGKTREGLYGALLVTTLYSLAAGYYFELAARSIVFLLILSVLLTMISVVGDLYESLLKREAGLKDSGKLLPGHGGMLDRIDSMLATMPLLVFGIHWLVQTGPGVMS